MNKITWKSPRTEIRNDFRRRIWESRCGEYRIVYSTCLLGPKQGREAIRPCWHAMRRIFGSCWVIVDGMRHRKKGPAVKAVERVRKLERIL